MKWEAVKQFFLNLNNKVHEPLECCCCLGPRKASIGIAIFNLIAYSLHLIHMGVRYYDASYDDYYEYCRYMTLMAYMDTFDRCAKFMMAFVCSTSISSIITLIATFILIQGIRKENPKYLLIYICVKIFFMTYYGMIATAIFLYFISIQQWGWTWIFLMLTPLGLFWEVFFVLLVRMFYIKLKWPEYYYKKKEEARARLIYEGDEEYES